jgi:hypothetical protein
MNKHILIIVDERRTKFPRGIEKIELAFTWQKFMRQDFRHSEKADPFP